MRLLKEEIKEAVAPVLEALELELFDIDVAGAAGRPIVRIYIDKEGGVSVEDCAIAGRHIRDLLDAEAGVAYSLEVSSPGVERPLRNIQDFIKHKGSLAKVKFSHEGKVRVISGVIKEVNADRILFIIEEKENVEVCFGDIVKANLKLASL